MGQNPRELGGVGKKKKPLLVLCSFVLNNCTKRSVDARSIVPHPPYTSQMVTRSPFVFSVGAGKASEN